MRLSSRNSNVTETNTNLYANRDAFKSYSTAMDDEPYIVAEINATNYPETFALGDNSSTADISDFLNLDYNGPLMEGRLYSYFVRFFSPRIPVQYIVVWHHVHTLDVDTVGCSCQEKYDG